VCIWPYKLKNRTEFGMVRCLRGVCECYNIVLLLTLTLFNMHITFVTIMCPVYSILSVNLKINKIRDRSL